MPSVRRLGVVGEVVEEDALGTGGVVGGAGGLAVGGAGGGPVVQLLLGRVVVHLCVGRRLFGGLVCGRRGGRLQLLAAQLALHRVRQHGRQQQRVHRRRFGRGGGFGVRV